MGRRKVIYSHKSSKFEFQRPFLTYFIVISIPKKDVKCMFFSDFVTANKSI